MHNVPRRKPMRGERYVCWHIGCPCRYGGPGGGIPPQDLGRTAKHNQ